MTQAEIKTELGTNRLFKDIMKRIKSGNWKQCSEAEKGLEQHKDALTMDNGIIFRVVVPFIPLKLRHLVLANWQKRMRHILGRMQLRLQSEQYHGGLE